MIDLAKSIEKTIEESLRTKTETSAIEFKITGFLIHQLL